MGRKNRDAEERERMFQRLLEAGIGRLDATALRRISMTLHNWHELECGTERGSVERNEETGALIWRNGRGEIIPDCRRPDLETRALRQLKEIMARYPTLQAYVQGDPRGCALYILRPGDVPEGERADACYNRGVAVHK